MSIQAPFHVSWVTSGAKRWERQVNHFHFQRVPSFRMRGATPLPPSTPSQHEKNLNNSVLTLLLQVLTMVILIQPRTVTRPHEITRREVPGHHQSRQRNLPCHCTSLTIHE